MIRVPAAPAFARRSFLADHPAKTRGTLRVLGLFRFAGGERGAAGALTRRQPTI
jgi:hypothetical protein